MQRLHFATLILSALLLQACVSEKSKGVIVPESLIDKSSERVTFSLAAPSAKQDVVEWLNKDMPSRAELSCTGADAACSAVGQELEHHGVPIIQVEGQPKAVLIYDRFAAHACNNRFRDNSFNPNNHNHSAFGCSVSSNIVQSVADTAQFTNPPLMDNAPAIPAVKSVRKLQAQW